jgi:hypothetical protein
MSPVDVRDYVGHLEACGLVHLAEGKSIDLTVADQQNGAVLGCEWASFVRREVAPGKTVLTSADVEDGDTDSRVAVPRGWQYEQSLSSNSLFVDGKDVEATMEPLNNPDGVEAFREKATGKVVYLGSPGASERQAEFEALQRVAQRALELEAMAAPRVIPATRSLERAYSQNFGIGFCPRRRHQPVAPGSIRASPISPTVLSFAC